MHHSGTFRRAEAVLDLNSKYWNIAFTSMLRQTQGSVWGNWGLHPEVRPGALGILNPETGDFKFVADIVSPKIVTIDSSQDWSMESSSVRQQDSSVDFKGGYIDPSTGTKVDVGLETKWSFERAGSILSRATISGDVLVDDFGTLLRDQYAYVHQKAESVGKTTAAGIVQGFGMITRVTRCKGVVNLGSMTDSSTFSITGSVDGVNSMTGSGDAYAGVKGSYKDTQKNGSFDTHLFPSAANTVEVDDAPLTFDFASFDGKLIIPQWTGPVSPLSLTFDNGHGGTYIVECKVTYDTPDAKDQVKEISVWGGQSHTIGGIPLDASNLRVTMHFKAGDTLFLSEARPLTAWPQGRRTIDLSGVWPWSCDAAWRMGE